MNNKNKNLTENKKDYFSDDDSDDKIKIDLYSTPIKKRKKEETYMRLTRPKKTRKISFNDINFSDEKDKNKNINMSENKNININKINLNNNC